MKFLGPRSSGEPSPMEPFVWVPEQLKASIHAAYQAMWKVQAASPAGHGRTESAVMAQARQAGFAIEGAIKSLRDSLWETKATGRPAKAAIVKNGADDPGFRRYSTTAAVPAKFQVVDSVVPHPCVAFVPVTLRARIPKPGYPFVLRHIGDHIRKRRLDLCLSQHQAAERLGVEASTVHNWEVKGTPPSTRYVPAVVSFLAYNPWPSACGTLPERLRATRIRLGLSQRAAAEAIGVDKHTVWGWEKRRRKICGSYVERVERFLFHPEVVRICVAAVPERFPAAPKRSRVAAGNAAEKGGRTPAMALSAHSGHEDRAKSLRAGFVLHPAKPCDPTELADLLAAVVRQ